MGAAATRVTTKSRRVTWAACSKALATASREPASHTKAMLSGTSSHTAGAPRRVAAVAPATAGTGSYSTTTWAAPSTASSAVSATTSAMGSPTCRARSHRESGTRRLEGRRAVALLSRAVGGQVAQTVRGQIGTSEHGDHARCFEGGGGVDPSDARVRVRGPHHHRVGLAGQAHVVTVSPEALHEMRILHAAHRLPHRELLDGDGLAHDSPRAERSFSRRSWLSDHGRPPITPPSTTRAWPLTKVDSSLASHRAARAMSSGTPGLLIG